MPQNPQKKKDSFKPDSFQPDKVDSFVADSGGPGRPEDQPGYGQRSDIFMRELSRQPIFAPGQTMNRALSQFPERPVAGGLNVLNALLQTAATPFVAGESALRLIPGGNTAADALTYPFHKIAEGVQSGERLIGEGLESLGIPNPQIPEAQALSGLNQGLAQMLVPGLMRRGGTPKPSDFLKKDAPPFLNKDLPQKQSAPGLRTAGDDIATAESAIPTAFKQKMLGELGLSKDLKIADTELIKRYQDAGLDKPAPLSEAPVSRGGSMDVRGAANQAQIEATKPIDIYGKEIKTDTPNKRGVKIDPEFAAKAKQLRDLNTFEAGQFSTTDYLRATEKIDGRTNGVVRRKIVRPVEEANFNAHAEYYKTQTELQRLSKETGVKEGTESSKRIFQSIEGRLEGELTPKEKRFSEFVKTKYDEYLTRLNDSRSKVNLEPIKKRQNYVTHINELNAIQDFFGSLSDSRIPPELIRAAEFSKPNNPFFRFMLERTGGKFSEDVVGAFSAYYRPAINNIHQTVPLTNARAYIKHLPPNASSYFTSWLNEAVANKTARFDRGIPKSALRGITALSGRIAKNLILGNVRVAAIQMSSWPQVLSEAGISNSVRGALRTLTPEGWNFAEKNSQILRLREFEGIEDINPSRFRRLEKMSAWHIEAADRMMVRMSFNSGLMKALREGKPLEEAVKSADDFAQKTQAAYGRMFKSPLLRSKAIGSTVGQFQVYTNNLMNYLVYDLFSKRGGESNARIVGKIGTFLGSAIAINKVYEELGLPSVFNPGTFIPTWNSIVKMAVDEENRDLAEAAGGGKFGTPAAIQTVVGLGAGAFRVGSGLATGNQKQLDKGFTQLLRNAPMVILPFGGGQVRKSVEGYLAVKEGGVRNSRGVELFSIDGTDEQIRTLIFGKYGSLAAQEYIKKMEEQRSIFAEPKSPFPSAIK